MDAITTFVHMLATVIYNLFGNRKFDLNFTDDSACGRMIMGIITGIIGTICLGIGLGTALAPAIILLGVTYVCFTVEKKEA